MFNVLPATVGHFVCKIVDTQLVYDFSVLNRGPNPVHVIFSLFFQHTSYMLCICKSRQFATVCMYPQIVDRPRLQCCPRSGCGVSEYVLGWRCLQIHTHTFPFLVRWQKSIPTVYKNLFLCQRIIWVGGCVCVYVHAWVMSCGRGERSARYVYVKLSVKS